MWNVDNGSQGAVLPSAGRRERDGNQSGIHLPWSGMEIWPASLPEFFLEGGPTGLPGNACFGFLAICILYKERLQEQIEAFSKKSVKNPNFFFLPPLSDLVLGEQYMCQTLRPLKSREGAVFIFNSFLCL